MKPIFLLILLYSPFVYAQKQPIDNESYRSWEMLSNYDISRDGKYVWYEYGSEKTGSTLVLCSSDGKYKKVLRGAYAPVFNSNSREFLFNTVKGLAILTLGTDSIEYRPNAHSVVIPAKGDGEWLTYHYKDSIILRNMNTGQTSAYHARDGVLNRQSLFLIQDSAVGCLNIDNGSCKTIMQGSNTGQLAFDTSGIQCCFIATNNQGHTLRYYRAGLNSAVTHTIKGLSDMTPQFSEDGHYIYFSTNTNTYREASGNITIWHYKDEFLPSEQKATSPWKRFRTYLAVMPTDGIWTRQLESEDTVVSGKGSKYVIIRNTINEDESYWNGKRVSYVLVSLSNGLHCTIVSNLQKSIALSLSPEEEYVVWYNPEEKAYFSYETATGVTRNISSHIPVNLYIDEYPDLKAIYPYDIAGWLPKDEALLIYDCYDIWKVDPTTKDPPVNITNGYGRKNHIKFRMALAGDTTLLTAFDQYKRNGFWRIDSRGTDPVSLSGMSKGLYYFPEYFTFPFPPPLKAGNTYLMKYMTDTTAPNLVATKDFRSFIQLSGLHPQSTYNWLSSELHNWAMPNGQKTTGILYKPENFDASKKYPVILHYYEKRSYEAYTYLTPALSNGTLDIPWYVSNGYLVFVPDITYPDHYPGRGALDAVTSAAEYLCRFPWVDKHKMGLQGHSFGGYETNYIITHSNLFAAAVSAAGLTDFITHYGDLAFGGKSQISMCEKGQLRMDTSLWLAPDIYVENSPLFSVDKVTTPLLMMHNQKDGAVPVKQSHVFYAALKYLGKPVWMLQYENEDHTIEDGALMLDFTIKQQEFFNHYLKGSPAPNWMK